MVKTKSMLVTRGFKQHGGIDFGETFASTSSSAIACECDLDLNNFGVDEAFVQLDLEVNFLRFASPGWFSE